MSPKADDKEDFACFGLENTFPGWESYVLPYFSHTDLYSQWRPIQAMLIWRKQCIRYQQSHTFEMIKYKDDGIMIWVGILLGASQCPGVFEWTNSDCCDILVWDPWSRLPPIYAHIIGNNIIHMGGNTRSHRTVVDGDNFDGHNLRRM